MDPKEDGRAQGDQQQQGPPSAPPVPGLKDVPENESHCVDFGQVLRRTYDGVPVLDQVEIGEASTYWQCVTYSKVTVTALTFAEVFRQDKTRL